MDMERPDVLITFLGRPPKHEGVYRTTPYDFGDGECSESTAFFGWTLLERLRPKRMVVLGTAGSIWDHLFSRMLDAPDQAGGEEGELDKLDVLSRATDNKSVTQSQLDALTPWLCDITGCEMRLVIVPYCRTEQEQTELLRVMAEHVQCGEHVHLDLTHGLRHLPMLAFISALHLRLVREANIGGIWYASFDPDSASAPVYRLDGLVRIADWLQALAGFEKDGDYGAFEPLLRQAGFGAEPRGHLLRASFFENTLNVGQATGELRKLLPTLTKDATEDPGARLVLPTVSKRLQWTVGERQYEKQLRLARLALDRRDYLRATLYAYEAVIKRICSHYGSDINKYDGREQARLNYEKACRQSEARREERKAYVLLKSLRNQLAHGTHASRGEVQKVLLDETRMAETLEHLLTMIETERLPAFDQPLSE